MALRLNTSEKSEIVDIRRFCFAFWDLPSMPLYAFIERPPGVPFQKIQFGNERGGRSVLSRLPELRIARILALLRSLILRLSSVIRKLSTSLLLGGRKLLVFYQLLLYYIPPDRSIYLAF